LPHHTSMFAHMTRLTPILILTRGARDEAFHIHRAMDNKERSDGNFGECTALGTLNLGSSVIQQHREHHHLGLQYYAQLYHHSRTTSVCCGEETNLSYI
jgi:hypothetical protein